MHYTWLPSHLRYDAVGQTKICLKHSHSHVRLKGRNYSLCVCIAVMWIVSEQNSVKYSNLFSFTKTKTKSFLFPTFFFLSLFFGFFCWEGKIHLLLFKKIGAGTVCQFQWKFILIHYFLFDKSKKLRRRRKFCVNLNQSQRNCLEWWRQRQWRRYWRQRQRRRGQWLR